MKTQKRALGSTRVQDINNVDDERRLAALVRSVEALELQRAVAEELGEYGSLPTIDIELEQARLDVIEFHAGAEARARLRGTGNKPVVPVFTLAARCLQRLVPVPVSWVFGIRKEEIEGKSKGAK